MWVPFILVPLGPIALILYVTRVGYGLRWQRSGLMRISNEPILQVFQRGFHLLHELEHRSLHLYYLSVQISPPYGLTGIPRWLIDLIQRQLSVNMTLTHWSLQSIWVEIRFVASGFSRRS